MKGKCALCLSKDIHLLLLLNIGAPGFRPSDLDWADTIGFSGCPAFWFELELHHGFPGFLACRKWILGLISLHNHIHQSLIIKFYISLTTYSVLLSLYEYIYLYVQHSYYWFCFPQRTLIQLIISFFFFFDNQNAVCFCECYRYYRNFMGNRTRNFMGNKSHDSITLIDLLHLSLFLIFLFQILSTFSSSYFFFPPLINFCIPNGNKEVGLLYVLSTVLKMFP